MAPPAVGSPAPAPRQRDHRRRRRCFQCHDVDSPARHDRDSAHINSMDDPAVRRVRAHFSGKLSQENEPPKLPWLRRHKRDVSRQKKKPRAITDCARLIFSTSPTGWRCSFAQTARTLGRDAQPRASGGGAATSVRGTALKRLGLGLETIRMGVVRAAKRARGKWKGKMGLVGAWRQ